MTWNINFKLYKFLLHFEQLGCSHYSLSMLSYIIFASLMWNLLLLYVNSKQRWWRLLRELTSTPWPPWRPTLPWTAWPTPWCLLHQVSPSFSFFPSCSHTYNIYVQFVPPILLNMCYGKGGRILNTPGYNLNAKPLSDLSCTLYSSFSHSWKVG